MQYGATKAEWGHFSLILGLTVDLLPCVSNPQAVISPNSKMAGVGKTPSRYNGQHQAVGFADWTSHVTTEREVQSWGQQPDYGICLQTRYVRALDIDIDNQDLAGRIADRFVEVLALGLPTRTRSNSGKRLLAFALSGEFYKRKFKVEGGIVEFLATGQQFIAVGTHTSGVPYEWAGGLPLDIPEIPAEMFEQAWAAIATEFAIEPPDAAQAPSKALKLAEAHANDPVALRLTELGMVHSIERDGRMDIVCPFASGHSTESSESSTSYYPANTGGYVHGHFHCLHASCSQRSDQEFEEAIGISPADDFEDLGPAPAEELIGMETPSDANRFRAIPAAEFAVSTPPSWIIKGILPQAELAVMFGDSGSGKSFMALDLAGAIARGEYWRERKTTRGRVVYIAAEGASGCKNRLKAYAKANSLDLDDLDILFIPSAPSFLDKKDVLDVIAALRAAGEVRVVIVDTWAQVTAGSNENSGEDMGQALKACRAMHRSTGALVLLIHHSGKNASAGARGWSGLRAAADVELEVLRADEARVMSVTKQKDGEDGLEFGFSLRVLDIGEDDDGEVVTSCVVEETGDTRSAVRKGPVGPVEGEILGLIQEMQQEQQQWPWLPELAARVKTDKPDIVRKYKTAIAQLLARGAIQLDENDRVSIPTPGDNLI